LLYRKVKLNITTLSLFLKRVYAIYNVENSTVFNFMYYLKPILS